MREKHTEEAESKGIFYDELAEFARQKIRQHSQDLWEQEGVEWLGRERGLCKVNPAEKLGYDYGCGRVTALY